MSNTCEPNALSNWTKDEKYELLQALKEIGSRDAEQLSLLIGTKTPDDITKALEYYRKRAASQSQNIPDKKVRKSKCSYVPLSNWAKIISDHHNFDELHTETAAALRLIAEFEDRPPVGCTEKIDFKKIYYALADALEGKSLPEDNNIKVAIDQCCIEAALTSKAFLKSTAYRQVIRGINMAEKSLSCFPKPTDNNELSTLRQIAGQKSYNPLNIPETYLKSSMA